MDEKPLNLLLIEDDKNDALVIKYFLWEGGAQWPMRILTAETLEQGCAFLQDKPCEAVILDLGLPDSRGIESLLKIRAQNPEVPIIVLTGLRDEATALEALALGAQDYLIKGMINGYFLRRAISHAVARARQSAQFENILAQDPEGKVIVNQAGLICYANPAAAAFLGQAGEKLLGKPLAYPLPASGTSEVRTIESGDQKKAIETTITPIEWRKTRVRLVTMREIEPHGGRIKTGRRHEALFPGS